MAKKPLKKFEDFEDPVQWEAYILVLFAKRLSPAIKEGEAYSICLEYLHKLYTQPEDPIAEDIQELADQLLEGRSVSEVSH
jgi:hypothetical protein